MYMMDKLWISLLVLIITLINNCNGECNTLTNTFYDWTGSTYSVTSSEHCETHVLWCWDKRCRPDRDVFSAAITNTKWDWSDNRCNSNFITGSSGTDDMVCSTPDAAQIIAFIITPVDTNYYDGLFISACKIHDMCYKTGANGHDAAKDLQCDEQFKHNMKVICQMEWYHEGVYFKHECDLVAEAYAEATKVGGTHRGGINPNNCKNDGTLGCNSHFNGYLSSYETKSHKFVNDRVSTITFSNCHSSFDTQLRIYDSNGNDITSNSDNNCDGDDCDYDEAFNCDTSLRETFRFTNLAAGRYTIKINGYGSNYGHYQINTVCPLTCHAKGPCNDGYMDRTDGNHYWWECGGSCEGGIYWTDYGCNCACIPAGSCSANANYNDFNLYRYAPSLSFIRTFGVYGEYFMILVLCSIIIGLSFCCYRKRKRNKEIILKENIKYKVVSIVDSESEFERQEEKVPINLQDDNL